MWWKFRKEVAAAWCCIIAGAAVGVVSPSHAAFETIFTVNSVADAPDASADGVCETTIVGECTLRAALFEANNAVTDVRISFDIPGASPQRIRTYSTLPHIDNPYATVSIDGTTQPGYVVNSDPLAVTTQFGIELVGGGGSAFHGIVIKSAHNTVRGLNLHSFKKAILLDGPGAAYNEIVGVSIGLTPTGAYDPQYALRGGSSCIELINGAHHNRLGLPGDANRNVISGCDQKGIALYHSGTDFNTIQNSIIGLDPSGTQRRGTKSHGVDFNSGASNNVVGGVGWQERNVISGNFQSGVEISHGSTTKYNQVIGNSIGTDLAGTGANPQTVNGQIGIRLEGKASCSGVCGLDAGWATIADNVIVNSTIAGIFVDKGFRDSRIERNLIGVLPGGGAAANLSSGLKIESGVQRISISGNTIAYNGKGIQLTPYGSMPSNTTSSPVFGIEMIGNLVYGNGGSYQIDLAPFGLPNDASRGNAGVNNDIRIPLLSNGSATSVRVSTCGGCQVELFAASATLTYGGAISLVASGVANSSGIINISFPASPTTRTMTALATNGAKSTSEFSRNVTIPSEP